MESTARYTIMREDVSVVMAREYGEARTATTILAAIVAIGADARVLVLDDDGSTPWDLTTDVTIPANITLEIPFGVTVTGTGNLTVVGGLIAWRVDWFQGTGALLWLTGAGRLQTPQLHTGPAQASVLTLDTPLAVDQGGTAARTPAQARINLGIVPGVDVQPWDAELSALASQASQADRLFYFTGTGQGALIPLTPYSRTLFDDADALTWRATLGLKALAILDTVGTPQIDDRAVTLPKIQTITGSRLIGHAAGAPGPAQEITLGPGLVMSSGAVLDLSGTAVGGAGIDNRVGIWSGAGSLTYDDSLIWDRVNHRLGIAMTPGAFGLDVNAGIRALGLTVDNRAGEPVNSIISRIAHVAGQNRFNLYIEGTARNFFQGDTGFGTNNPTFKVDVAGHLRAQDAVFASNAVYTKTVYIQDASGNTNYPGDPVAAFSGGIMEIVGQYRLNLNMAGTAHNYIVGNTGIGGGSRTDAKLAVTGGMSTDYMGVNSVAVVGGGPRLAVTGDVVMSGGKFAFGWYPARYDVDFNVGVGILNLEVNGTSNFKGMMDGDRLYLHKADTGDFALTCWPNGAFLNKLGIGVAFASMGQYQLHVAGYSKMGELAVGTDRDGSNFLKVGTGNFFCMTQAYKPGGGPFIDSSRRELKTNIAPIDDALGLLLAQHGRQYEWIDPLRMERRPGVQYGFIFDEVTLEQWRDDVGPDGQGGAIGATGFEALAIEALRQLVDELTTLKARLAVLENN